MNEPSVQKLFDLTGKVALITGGAGYLGRSMAAALAEAGAAVVVSSRQRKRAQSVADSLPRPCQAKHFAVQLDHKDEESIERGFQETVEQAGEIDVLVNNGHSGAPDDLTTVDAVKFNDHLVNATGYFLLARLVRNRAVEQQKPASIVMLGSMYGLVGSYPDAYEGIHTASPVAYHALKGGVIQMTRHLAVYWARDKVRVNCLSPGPFPPERIPKEMVRRLCTKSPMARMGLPYELKGAIVFLASDASSYMTGQNLVIDGGWTAW